MRTKYLFRVFSLITIISLFIFVGFTSKANDNAKNDTVIFLDKQWEDLTCDQKLLYSQRLLEMYWYPYINKAIEKYYGQYRQYHRLKILRIQSSDFGYTVTIQVRTFMGPHNPPYGTETIKLLVDYGKIEVIDFQHKD